MSKPPPISLSGKVIVQWGGSGLLGQALARDLAGCGATLTIVSRDPAKLSTLTSEIQAQGQTVSLESADLGSETSIHGVRDRVLARHGRIDGFVYNAVARPMRTMDDDLSAWRESMETNATGCFAVLRAFGDVLAARQLGSMVAVSSIQGMGGPQEWLYAGTPLSSRPDYFFHKAGLINFARYLAAHYGPRGVRVNTVSPGGIFDPDAPQPAAFVERYQSLTMLGRMAAAHEVSGAVAFLLSDASAYVTGVNLPVDGGYSAK